MEKELTFEEIETYIEKFKKSEHDKESVLNKVLLKFPKNKDLDEVIIKVTILNSLYSARLNNNKNNRKIIITNINKTPIDVISMAEHIIKLDNLDDLMRSNKEDQRLKAFNYLALINENEKSQFKKCPSFASKYCNWHNKNGYPIIDNNAKKALYHISQVQNSGLFGKIKRPSNLDNYNNFYKISSDFKKYINETYSKNYTFKEIDMFLWMYGKEL